MRRASFVVAVIVTIIGIANFSTFFIASARYGDAQNGFERNGRFYISSQGEFHEISEEAWRRSLWHGRSVLVTTLLLILAMAYIFVEFVFPALIYLEGRDALERTAAATRESGPQIMKLLCGGFLGGVFVSEPLIHVAVHPAGVTIKPYFMPQCAILFKNIERVSLVTVSILGAWIEIYHHATSLASPVSLSAINRRKLAKVAALLDEMRPKASA